MNTQKITYQADNQSMEGYVAQPNTPEKKPLVLIAHDWTGRNEFACKKAEKIAELGYVGFAMDLYGQGKLGQDNDEKMQLMKPLMDDRSLLLKRLLAALETAKKIEGVDTNRIAAMGFCFGGLCVLDLARSGADIKGVVSFHGLLGAPEKLPKHKIKSKILALHGYNDPMGKPEQVNAFADEMTQAGADWQIHMYGNTLHAFTNPLANDPDFGTVYDQKADARSWIAMKDFFAEIFK